MFNSASMPFISQSPIQVCWAAVNKSLVDQLIHLYIDTYFIHFHLISFKTLKYWITVSRIFTSYKLAVGIPHPVMFLACWNIIDVVAARIQAGYFQQCRYSIGTDSSGNLLFLHPTNPSANTPSSTILLPDLLWLSTLEVS